MHRPKLWVLAALTFVAIVIPPLILSRAIASLQAQSGSLTLENQQVRISVFADRGGLNEIVHKPSGLNLRTRTTDAFRQIWSLNFSLPDGSSVQVDNAHTTTFRSSVISNTSSSSLDLTWQGLQPAGRAPIPNVVVHATITLGAGDSAATWKWEAQNLGGLVIQNVMYPVVSGIGQLGGNDIFVAPFQEGRVYRNPVSHNVRFSAPYPSGNMNMQFMALSSSAVTFALRTQDTSGYVKEFRFNPSTSTAGDYVMQIVHDFDLVPSDRLSVPYDVVLAMFSGPNGDWTDAADDYKKWAYNQSWVQQARSRSTPDWLLNTGASKLLCETGCQAFPNQTYQQNASLLLQDQQSLGASLLALLQGWEKYGAWYYGDYFPPSGGWNAFDAGILSAKQRGNRWWLFISPRGRRQPAFGPGALSVDRRAAGSAVMW